MSQRISIACFILAVACALASVSISHTAKMRLQCQVDARNTGVSGEDC